MSEPVSVEFTERSVDKPQKKDVLKPPNKDLKVTYVIPIKGEVKNGNIFHQLKDFTIQDRPVSDFEAIYVVNNTQEERTTQNDSFKENQQLLSIVRFIGGETDTHPDGLEEWQREIVISAKEKGVHIQALDLSTDGMTEKNIEKARFIGNNLAVERFAQTEVGQDNGAIMMMDADTKISRQMSSQLIEQLVNNPDIGMLKIPYDRIPGEAPGELGERLYQTTSQERFSNNVEVFKKLFFGIAYHGRWHALKARALGHRDPDNPSQTIRDMETIQPLSGEMAFGHDMRIYTQDRARSENVGGAHGESRLDYLYEHQKPFEGFDPAVELLVLLYEHHERDNTLTPELREKIITTMRDCLGDATADFMNPESGALTRQKSKYFVARDDHRVGVKEYTQRSQEIIEDLLGDQEPEMTEFHSIVKHEVEREKIRHAVGSGVVNRVLERMYDPDKNQRELSTETIHEYLSDIPRQQTPRTHFVYQNPWIINILNEVRQEASNPDGARGLLNEKFPELLLPFDETEYTKANATMLGLNRFIEKVRANPNAYPTASQIFPPLYNPWLR